MAIEYTFETAAPVPVPQALTLLREVVGGEAIDGSWLRAEGMHVTPLSVDPGDRESTVETLGFVPKTTITFRLLNNAGEPLTRTNIVAMVNSVLSLISTYGGDAVLLLNDEQIVLQHLGANTTLDSTWEYWVSIPELAALTHSYPTQPVPQPFL